MCTKFILFSQVGSLVTPAPYDSGTVGADNSRRQYSINGVSTSLTCTALVHRVQNTSRFMPKSQTYRVYSDNFGVVNYQNKESYTGTADNVVTQESTHRINVKHIVATTKAEADVEVNPN